MSCAQMWWSETYVEWPGDQHLQVQFDATSQVVIRGAVNGPGNDWLWLDAIETEILIITHFSLPTKLMPPDGIGFRSAPQANFSGHMMADTSGWAIRDLPSAICDLELRQEVPTYALTSFKKQRLLEISNRQGNDQLAMPSSVDFEPIAFYLDRTRPLEIDLLLTFRMYLEGSSIIWYDFWRDRPLLTAVCREWCLNSVLLPSTIE